MAYRTEQTTQPTMREFVAHIGMQRNNGRLLATLLMIVGLAWIGLSVVGFMGVGAYAGNAYWPQVFTMMAFTASLSIVPFVAAGLAVAIPTIAALLSGRQHDHDSWAQRGPGVPPPEDLMPHDPRDQPEQSADVQPWYVDRD